MRAVVDVGRATASCSPPTTSTSRPSSTCGAGTLTTTAARGRAPATDLEARRAHRGGRRLHGGAAVSHARSQRRQAPRCSAARPSAAWPWRHPSTPNVTLLRAGARRLATAVLLHRRAPLPTTGCPCSLDPYGGPHSQRVLRSRNLFFASPVVRRPGLRRRGGRRPGHAWARAARGSERSTATWPSRCSTTRWRPCTWRPPSTHSSTSAGWRSAAGASAATSPRSPCSGGPTCSTPRSPARPSPSGGSTTPTTPSATSATPTVDPRPYDRSSLLLDAHRLERPLLLIHGLADDNVVAAHTLAALVGAAGRGQAAPGAAALRRHPHDAPGGGRRELVAPATRVPAPGARPRRPRANR